MADDPKVPEPFSLARWSRRKHEAARESPTPPEPANPPPPAPIAGAAPAQSPAPEALPAIDSLSIDSDFRAFMKPKVDEEVKRAALKKLFSDPAFNVMDGLDVYIDDYTKPDPMPAGMLAKLAKVYDAIKPAAELDATAAESAPAPTLAAAAADTAELAAPESESASDASPAIDSDAAEQKRP